MKEFNKSAITDHVNKENHKIYWRWVSVVLNRESDMWTRAIKEAVHIWMHRQVINRDKRADLLARVYDQVLTADGRASRAPLIMT